MTEHPGYVDAEKVSEFPLAQTVYFAFYELRPGGDRLVIVTVTFNNSGDLDADLEEIKSASVDGDWVLLRDGNVLVVVEHEEDSEIVAGIADKLSRRLGMVVVYPEEPGVVLTLSERGALNIANLTEVELLSLGMDENPGYVDAEKVSEFPLAQTVYFAFYELRPGGDRLVIATVTFNNSGDLDADLEEIKSASVDGDWVLLRDGNVLVVVEHEEDSEIVAGIADKLSRRLGMVVVYPEEPEVANNYI